MLKVGIAGFGVVGKKRKDCVNKHSKLSLVAVCDKNFKNLSYTDDGIKCYETYHQLLKEKLDILFVCLTNDIAAEVTIAGLELGIHVFCEKPPGRNVEDILKVIECEANHPNLKLMYGFNHRYHDSVKDALDIIQSRKLGKIINLRGVYGKSKMMTFNQSDWRTRREKAGGGILLDQGIHMVDLMRLFAGEFEDVYSFVSNSHWGYDVEDNAYGLLRTKNGVVAMINSSATQWRHSFNLHINLDKGSIILGGILSGTKSYGAETLTVVRSDPANDLGDPSEEVFQYNVDPSWDNEISLFVNSINNNLPINSSSSNDALLTMKLVYRIYYADPEWRKSFNILNPDID
jgi:predicted dehydrogenase